MTTPSLLQAVDAALNLKEQLVEQQNNAASVTEHTTEMSEQDQKYVDFVMTEVETLIQWVRQRGDEKQWTWNLIYFDELMAVRGAAIEYVNKRLWHRFKDAFLNVIYNWLCYGYLATNTGDTFQEYAKDTLAACVEDVKHHFSKYGPQRLDVANWLMVITEEEGEAARAALDSNEDELQKELRQVIACWMRLYTEVIREMSGIADK